MSDAAFTRLVDLLELGYEIETEACSERGLVLDHPSSPPRISLWRDGSIWAMDGELWPSHLRYPDPIPARDGNLFANWCQQFDQPSLSERLRFRFGALRRGLIDVRRRREALRDGEWFDKYGDD